MKLHLENTAENRIRAYGPQGIRINEKTYESSLIVTPTEVFASLLPEQFSAFSMPVLERLLALQPEILLIGTGNTQQFLHHEFLRVLHQHHLGTEVMATDAACRTYNILASEGRQVVAALFKLTYPTA